MGPATGVRGRTRTERMAGRSCAGAGALTAEAGAFASGGGALAAGGVAFAAGGEIVSTAGSRGRGGGSTVRPAKEGGASARTVSAASPTADDVSKRLMVMAWRLGTGR